MQGCNSIWNCGKKFICMLDRYVFSSIGMSQIAPILPLYIKQLGVTDVSLIQQYSGIILDVLL